MNKNKTTKSYFMLSATPSFYDRPIVPNKKYDLADESFLAGLHISWYFLAFKVKEQDGVVTFSLGLNRGDFLDIKVELPQDKLSADKLYDYLRKCLGQCQERTLHRTSCQVKTNITPYGVGISDPIVGWYNSTQHLPITVQDITQFLVADADRYVSSSHPSSFQVPSIFEEYYDPNPYQNFRDHFCWYDYDGNPMDVPVFLHYSYRDYLANPELLNFRTVLPSMRQLYEGKRARYFKWLSQPITQTTSLVDVSSCGRYLKSYESLKGFKVNCDWVQLTQPEELDHQSLVSLSKNQKIKVMP